MKSTSCRCFHPAERKNEILHNLSIISHVLVPGCRTRTVCQSVLCRKNTSVPLCATVFECQHLVCIKQQPLNTSAVLQTALNVANSTLTDSVLLSLESQYSQKLSALNQATYASYTDRNAAIVGLNITYRNLVSNVQNRHYSACENALSPMNLPAIGSFPAEFVWRSIYAVGVSLSSSHQAAQHS